MTSLTLPFARGGSGTGNRLLARLGRAEQALLAPSLEPVDLPFGETLRLPGAHITHVVFPDSGLVSLLAEMGDGVRAEVGLVGREGLVGLQALLGLPVAMSMAVVQIPGWGWRIPVSALGTAMDGNLGIRGLLHRYAMARLLHANCTAACNAAHPLERRAARWLLMVQDRVGPGFPMTQEFLATMLATHRPTVNPVLRHFTREGILRRARGRIAVADRARLEASACRCYGIERAGLDHLLPGSFD